MKSTHSILAFVLVAICAVSGGAEEPDIFDEAVAKRRAAEEAAELETTARAHLDEAKTLFAEMADHAGTDEESKARRDKINTNLERARGKLFLLAESHVDKEEIAEDLLMELDSLAFWVKRMTPLDLDLEFAKPARDSGSTPAPGDDALPDSNTAAKIKKELTIDTLPEGVRPARHADAGAALAAADAAEKAGAPGAAFYDLLEVLQHHKRDEASRLQALARIEMARENTLTEELLAYLRGELKSADPLLRVFAAREIAFLGQQRSVEPLVSALKDEKIVGVREKILEAIRFAPKRAAARELAKLSRADDPDLKLLVIDALATRVGGRHGALALAELAAEKDDTIWRSAVGGISIIGGDAAAAAFGKITRDANSPPKLVHECFHALSNLGSDAAADQLSVHLVKKGRYLYTASDDAVRMGGVAAPALIRALDVPKLRPEANDCLKRISGENMGASAEKWKDWYRTWKKKGEPALPRYARGTEPWNGGR